MGRIKKFLQNRKEQGAYRELHPLVRLGNGRVKMPDSGLEMIDFSSNDYLGLAEHPEVIKRAEQNLLLGAGAGAARLMSGDLNIHHHLEQAVAKLKNKQAALLFGSGYLANIGVIPALVGRRDVIFCDRLNHASIYDGCRLSGAKIIRFHHNNTDHLGQIAATKRQDFNRALVVVESIYSMDGDRCPLQEITKISREYNCQLMVDEAHATGLFGTNGGGIIEEESLSDDVDIAMGTFSKALGSYGAYIATSEELVQYFINKARSFIYATALPPAVVGASLAAVELVQKNDDLRRELFDKVTFFKKCLSDHGIDNDLGPSQIVPIVIGESSTAVKIAENLQQQGIYATAVRPPTVPEGTARLRFSIIRHHKNADLKITARIVAKQILAHRPANNNKALIE